MAVRIGISPIAWQNDDLPDLTAGFTMEQALREAREIGYTGVERGQRMPRDTEGLAAYLKAADIALCGGWCSGASLVNDLAAEIEAVRDQVLQFIALSAPCIVYAECSNTVQGQRATPLSARPRLDPAGIAAYARRVTDLARWMNDLGMAMAYHPHMGAIIQDEDDVNRFMDASGPEVGLCFDTGHLAFAGADVVPMLQRWSDRVVHVHYKDIRPVVVADVHANDRSFLDAVIAGAFTVPGDGCIDFNAVTARLKAMEYSGWIVVEAEQDPAKAPPYACSKRGYEHIAQLCRDNGLTIAP